MLRIPRESCAPDILTDVCVTARCAGLEILFMWTSHQSLRHQKSTGLEKISKEFCWRKEDPHQVFKKEDHALTVDEKEFDNVVSFDRANLIATRNGAGMALITPQGEQHEDLVDAHNRPSLKEESGYSPQEYVVEKLLEDRLENGRAL